MNYLLLKFAARNVGRHFRRSLFTVLTIAVGLAIIIWMNCLFQGQTEQIIEQVTSTYPGDFQITRLGYFEDKKMSLSFKNDFAILMAALPEGSLGTERLHLTGVLSTGENSVSIRLDGVDAISEFKLSKIGKFKTEGELLSPQSDPECELREIYIGDKLAKKLEAGLGEKLVFVTQSKDGDLGNELFRLKGIFHSDNMNLNEFVGFTHIECVRKIGMLSGMHEWVVKLPEHSMPQKLFEKLKGLLPAGFEIKTWEDVVPAAALLVQSNQSSAFTVALMLYILSTLGTVNTILMNVFERTREFGIMLALGIRPEQVVKLIFFEAAILGVASATLGTILGVAVVLYQSHFGYDFASFTGKHVPVAGDFMISHVIYPVFAWEKILFSIALTLFFTILAGVIPAIKASRLAPVETLRG